MKARSLKMKMPDFATNEGAELEIRSWLVQVGDRVLRGQPILEIETDKSAMEVEAIADGILAEKLVGEGDAVVVGTPIARIELD